METGYTLYYGEVFRSVEYIVYVESEGGKMNGRQGGNRRPITLSGASQETSSKRAHKIITVHFAG